MRARVLAYDVRGEGDTLVLVPGGLTGWLSWVPHAQRLSATRKTIRVQPIHNELGSAEALGDPSYTAETERESLRLTLDDLALASADFAGWSGGGRALIEFALAHRERVRTLTLVEPAAYWVLEQLGEPDEEVERLNGFMHGLAGGDVSESDLSEFLQLAGFVTSAAEAHSHPNWKRWVPHRMALSWSFEALDHPARTIEELPCLDAPVLLVKGTTTAEWLGRVVDALAERLPNASVLELPGDHACHIQSIDAFLDALDGHLSAAR